MLSSIPLVPDLILIVSFSKLLNSLSCRRLFSSSRKLSSEGAITRCSSLAAMPVPIIRSVPACAEPEVESGRTADRAFERSLFKEFIGDAGGRSSGCFSCFAASGDEVVPAAIASTGRASRSILALASLSLTDRANRSMLSILSLVSTPKRPIRSTFAEPVLLLVDRTTLSTLPGRPALLLAAPVELALLRPADGASMLDVFDDSMVELSKFACGSAAAGVFGGALGVAKVLGVVSSGAFASSVVEGVLAAEMPVRLSRVLLSSLAGALLEVSSGEDLASEISFSISSLMLTEMPED